VIPVVLDTDIGTDIDDTWALAMLLRCPELDLRLVVTTSGDVEYRGWVTAGILAAAGRKEVPVALGVGVAAAADRPQERVAVEARRRGHPAGLQSQGVEALVDTVMSSASPVTIVSIGPASTLAAALTVEPAICERARVVAMYGSVRVGYDGRPGPDPEYNVVLDVGACRAVLAAPWDVTITPLDTCGSVVLAGERYLAVRRAPGPLVDALVRASEEWAVATSQPTAFEERTTTLFDTVAVYLAYAEDLVGIEHLSIAIDDDGRMRVQEGAPVTRVATSWRDADAFADHLVARLTSG
jgi:inosine-uridine nucleoside N-ribohydrolase